MARLNVLDGVGLDATVRRIQRQTVLTYPTTYERGRDLPNPWLGATTLLTKYMALEAWDGEKWVPLGGGSSGAGIIAVAPTAGNATYVYTGSADPHRLATFDRINLRAGRYYRMTVPLSQAMDPGPAATSGFVQFRPFSDPDIYTLAGYGDGGRFVYIHPTVFTSQSVTLTWLFAVESSATYTVWVDFYLKPSGRTLVDAAETAWIEDLGAP